MPPSQRSLPLFPLNTVLFPNAMLPLHVFEERYRLMIRRCLDGDSQFGVVLIKSGLEVGEPAEPHSVGTVAHIERVNPMDDGRMLLSVKGVSRFTIKQVTQQHPYLEGDVEVMDDEAGAEAVPAEKLATIRAAVTRHISLMMGMKGGWVREAKSPADPAALSYFVGTLLQSDLAVKQALLEEPSTAKRLHRELVLLDEEAANLQDLVAQTLGRRGAG